MKWDESVIEQTPNGAIRVRRAYFQDHRTAHVLEDRAGTYLVLREAGTDEIIAEASRHSSRRWWTLKPRQGGRWVQVNGKDEVIADMLGCFRTEENRANPGLVKLSERISLEVPVPGQGPLRMWHQNARGEHYDFMMAKDAEERLLEVLLARRNARLAAMMAGN